MTATEVLERARRFLGEELWRWEIGQSAIRAIPLRVLQLCVLVGEGFVRDRLLLRASALTYMAIFAVIPGLAMVLGIVQALGVSENLAGLAVSQLAAGYPEVQDEILELIRNAKLGGLGTIGATLVLFTTVLALRHGEQALNEIWSVAHGRTWVRRFTDYLAVMIVAPVLTAVGISAATTLQAEPIVRWLLQFPLFEMLYHTGLRYAPTLLIALAFGFVYWFLPNTSVRVGSALLGGVVAAILFSLAQALYVNFNVGVSRYNAFFGAFAALPLLLMWIYVSTSIVLLGAEVSCAHQNLARYRRDIREEVPGPAACEALAIRVVVEVARAFRDRLPEPSVVTLSDALNAPVRSLRDVLELLETAEIVAGRTVEDRMTTYLLRRPAEQIQVGEVLSALRGERPRARRDADEADLAVEKVVGDLESSAKPIAARTVAELLAQVPPPTASAVPSSRADAATEPARAAG